MAGYYWDDDEDETYSDRDAPLIFKYSSPELAEIIASLTDDAKDRSVMNVILTELCLAAEAGKAMSYSRHEGYYALSCYRPHVFGYSRMMRVVALMVRAGLALEDRTPPGHRGWQSTLTATPALYQSWVSMNADPVYARGVGVILKSRAKNSHGQLVDFPSSRMTKEFGRGVDKVNEMFAGTTFDVPAGKQVRKNLLLFEQPGFDDYGNPIAKEHFVRLTPDNAGRRIFTGNFRSHGRFYCPLQNVPSEARLSMLIDRESVIETDIKALHPTLLYNLAGVKMDGDDPYVLEPYPRKHIKLAFVIVINAPTLRRAVAALARKLKTSHSYAAEVIEAMKRRHKPIAPYFCSDIGIRLMNDDSQIAMGATIAMVGDGISALLVHDSWVVPARHIGQAEARIQEHFDRHFRGGSRCNVNHCNIERKMPLSATYGAAGSRNLLPVLPFAAAA